MNFDGFYLIDKPNEWTSFDVCAKLRKVFKIKKVGHTGTLDPFATGLLVVAVGKCTRLIPFLEKACKTYMAKILLGKTSETLDPESEIVDCGFTGKPPNREEIEKLLKEKFTGKIEQIPPQFSAIKMGGKKAYELARKGEKVEMKPRKTEIFRCEILDYQFPELTVELEVAAGFYVRSFASDLGKMLAGGGLCSELRRTKINDISIKDAEKIEPEFAVTTPIDPKFLITNIAHREIPAGRVQDFVAGRAFDFPGMEKEKVLVLCGGKTFGIGEITCGKLQPRVVI